MELFINDNQLVFEHSSTNKWAVEIDKIRLIGEYTTADGPWLDDYFFVFAEKEDEWYEAPNEAVKNHDFWEILSEKLNFKVAPSLFASTQWDSKVLFPKDMKGQKLFQVITEKKPARTLWQKLMGSSAKTEKIAFAENVKKIFN
ncbi:hypothetical protein [Rufibacter aurantiacus]|uniref:hypothetical protein n=1 Tax=Rufibacter aurantiacus TaxID=2817374 RepID=UPI001B30FEE5|nr:hypothetical protein [Rufibacter aurantiacus]